MNIKLIIAPFVTLSFAIAVPANAESDFMNKCKPDLVRMGCGTTSDQEAHQCLEEKEAKSKKEGFVTKDCHRAEEKFEKSQGHRLKTEVEEERNEH